MIATANPIPSSAAAPPHAATSPSLELLEARRARDALAALLRREHEAMADFLLALADFDRRRGFEPLGFASTFAFLLAGLGLSPAATHWRLSAARLLVRFPEVIEPLKDGRLCLTTAAELAKVLNRENLAEVLPRFYGASSLKAKELVAELQPREAPPLRTVVTAARSNLLAAAGSSVATAARSSAVAAAGSSVVMAARSSGLAAAGSRVVAPAMELPLQPTPAEPAWDAAADTYSGSLRAPEVEMTHPARGMKYRPEVEPLTADLRRLSMTVTRRFLEKLGHARDGLSHAIPRATTEQVLEAAIDLLLEKQARARGLVKRPRTVVAAVAPIAPLAQAPTTTAAMGAPSASASASAPTSASATIPALDAVPAPAQAQAQAQAPVRVPVAGPVPVSVTAPATATDTSEDGTETPPPSFTPPLHRRAGARKHVPAAIVREVWQRDGGRCAWPLDGGGVCGSTHRLEIDHVIPWARWGGETVSDLRIVCATHNRLAARQVFGERCMARYAPQASP